MPSHKKCFIPLVERASASFKQDIIHIVKECVPKKALVLEEPNHPLFFKFKSPRKGGAACFLFLEKRKGVEKFVFDMVSSYFLPSRRLDFSAFEAFSLSYPSKRKFVAIRIFFDALSPIDIQDIQGHLPFFLRELAFGATSYYQGLQVLELKGTPFEEKMLFLQEKIKALIQRFPRHFDYDMVSLMKQMALSLSEGYKKECSQKGLFTILRLFYRLRKLAKAFQRGAKIERFAKVELKVVLSVQKRSSLLVCLSFALVDGKEMFEKKDVLQLVKGVQNFFSFVDVDTGMQQFCLEVDAGDIARKDLPSLKKDLESKLSMLVRPLTRPLFMPRNEEEVMKSLVTLSKQIRSLKDKPEVMIHFEKQEEGFLAFRVLIVRVLEPTAPLANQMVELSHPSIKLSIERVKKVGVVDRIADKEAIVLMMELPLSHFLRMDGSLDLFQARYEVVLYLKKIFGSIRDFNGTMIEKEMEQLLHVKSMIKDQSLHEELDRFFFSLYPIEFRAIWPASIIAEFFCDYLNWKKKQKGSADVFFASFVSDEEGDRLFERWKERKEFEPHDRMLVKCHFAHQKIVGIKNISYAQKQ